MTKEQKNRASTRGKFLFSNTRSQITILGTGVVVAGIYLIFPMFWKDHWIFVSLISIGFAMLPLFSLWKSWMEYGWQVGIAPGLTFVLMGIFIWFFGYDSDAIWMDAFHNLFWTNLGVLSIWLILVMFAFRTRPHGEVWRDYRWIIAPAILILLFLFDTSWAQSTLSTSSLKKNVIHSTPPDTLQFYAKYPSRVLFDDADSSEIHLWVIGSLNCEEQEISGQGLLFAIKPPPDTPLEWSDKLTFKLNKTTTAVTLLIQPFEPTEPDSRFVQLNLSSGGKSLETPDWKITVESKHDSQVRAWKKYFLDTGGIVVSLITAVFVGIKQLEEEKKRQNVERVKQAIATFDTDSKNDFSKALKEHLELTADWNEWDRATQDQFCDKYSSFVEEGLWNIVANITLTDVPSIIERCLQVCERIFDGEQEKPISTIKQLQSAMEKKDHSELNLFVQKYPESGVLVKQIEKTLDVPITLGTEYIPRQGQIRFLAKQFDANNKLTMWLEKHQMIFSPFLDAPNVFSLLPKENKMLIELATTRFVFNDSLYQERQLSFSNVWDLRAGLFEYLKQMPPKVKPDTFIILLTPEMFLDFGVETSLEQFFHALAEAWIWELIDDWSTYYSLTYPQRGLVGRLLCWHGNSPDAILSRLEQIFEEQNRNNSAQKMMLQIIDWLENIDSSNLQLGEMKSLIDLRPLPKRRTLLVNLAGTSSTKLDAFPFFEQQTNWPKRQAWSVVNFQISVSIPRLISTTDIIQQCNERVNLCSNNLIQGFDELFIPHNEKPAEKLLAEKADGSPGKMVRLGQKLLFQHVEKYSLDEPLHIEDLITLE